jgi:rare lipoprotein A
MKNKLIVLTLILTFFMSCTTMSKKTMSGVATYNENEPGLKAAHAKLDFDTRVRVINLNNNRSVIVTITERIPEDPHRIIHIGKMAGDNIEMSQTYPTPVVIEVLGRPKYSTHLVTPAAN